jgi:hypothetical protein
MVMVDCQAIQGRRAGPGFHTRGRKFRRTKGTKRAVLVDVLGLLVAALADAASNDDTVRLGGAGAACWQTAQSSPACEPHRWRPQLQAAIDLYFQMRHDRTGDRSEYGASMSRLFGDRFGQPEQPPA